MILWCNRNTNSSKASWASEGCHRVRYDSSCPGPPPLDEDPVSTRGLAGRSRCDAAAGGDATVSRPTVEIRLEDRRLLSRKVEGVAGDPPNPVTRDTLEPKFCDCVFSAAVSLAPKNIDAAIALINDLENVA